MNQKQDYKQPVRFIKLINDLIKGGDEYVGCDRILKNMEKIPDIGFEHSHRSKQKYIEHIQQKKEMYQKLLMQCNQISEGDLSNKKQFLKDSNDVILNLEKSTSSVKDWAYFSYLRKELKHLLNKT